MLHLLLAGPRRPAQKKKRKKRVEVRNIMHGSILTLKKCTSTSVKLKNDFFGGINSVDTVILCIYLN